MSQLEYDILKKINQGIEKQNELLQQLINLQQPKTEVVSDKPRVIKPRGNRRGNQKQS